MYKKYLFSIFFIVGIIFSGCSKDKKDDSSSQMISKKEYLLKSTNDKELMIKQVNDGFIINGSQNKIVLFDIFATWCPPCRASAKNLSSLQEKYKDNLVVVGLSIEENIEKEKLNDFAKEYKATYYLAHTPQTKNLIYDIVKKLNVGAKYPIPLMSLYKDGKLINYYVGATQEEFIESDIKNALEAK